MSVDILSWLDDTEPVKSEVVGRTISTDTLTTSETKGTCFEVSRDVLLHLMEKAIIIVPNKDIIPAYTNFKFKVGHGLLSISASNGETSIEVWTDQVHCLTEGTEFFPARALMSVVKEGLAGSTTYIEATPSGVVVVSGNFSAQLPMLASAKFELPYQPGTRTIYDVNKVEFIDALATLRYALPKRDFNGQASLKMINIQNGKFTACDGSRFQQVRIDGFNLSMKLDALSINNLLKVLSFNDGEEFTIAETDNDYLFGVGALNFFVKKMSKPYPNVEQLWLRPALSNDQAFVVDRDELITAIKQVKTAADLGSTAVTLDIESDKVLVSISGINNRLASTTIACKLDGKARKVVVNYLHLAEMLKAYKSKECRFLLGPDTASKKTPILLKDDDTMALATISQLVAYRAGM